MQFVKTPFNGAYLIKLLRHEDERGYFSRLFCADRLRTEGMDFEFSQVNHSMSKVKGTLRGMHYQLAPYAETKAVRCIRGAIYDVILDLRPGSETFGQSFGVRLSEEDPVLFLIPEGFAHGFITLENNTELMYLVSMHYNKESERGVRWNDPFFNIKWPETPTVISEKDCNLPDFDPNYHLASV